MLFVLPAVGGFQLSYWATCALSFPSPFLRVLPERENRSRLGGFELREVCPHRCTARCLKYSLLAVLSTVVSFMPLLCAGHCPLVLSTARFSWGREWTAWRHPHRGNRSWPLCKLASSWGHELTRELKSSPGPPPDSGKSRSCAEKVLMPEWFWKQDLSKEIGQIPG